MEIISKRRFIKTAPDKIRILSEVIKKKKIDDAIFALENTSRYGAKPLILILKQAKDMIKNKNMDINSFSVAILQVNEGPKLKRRRIIHRGRATAILKRMSHATIVLKDDEKPKTTQNPKQISKTENIKQEKDKFTLSDRRERNGSKS